MDDGKRKLTAGWIEKASNHLDAARADLKSYRTTEAIQAAQVCVELSVKAILTLLNIDFPRSHGWDEKQLARIAEQITKSGVLSRLPQHCLGHVRLPRLLVLANLWNQFYIQAKYGIEVGYLAPAQELFGQREAELAVAHAEECYFAAIPFRNLTDEELTALLTA